MNSRSLARLSRPAALKSLRESLKRRFAKWVGGQFARTSRVYTLQGAMHAMMAMLTMSEQAANAPHAAFKLVVFGLNALAAWNCLRRVIHERSYESGLLVGKASHPPAHQIVIVDAPTFHRLAHLPPSAFIPREPR